MSFRPRTSSGPCHTGGVLTASADPAGAPQRSATRLTSRLTDRSERPENAVEVRGFEPLACSVAREVPPKPLTRGNGRSLHTDGSLQCPLVLEQSGCFASFRVQNASWQKPRCNGKREPKLPDLARGGRCHLLSDDERCALLEIACLKRAHRAHETSLLAWTPNNAPRISRRWAACEVDPHGRHRGCSGSDAERL